MDPIMLQQIIVISIVVLVTLSLVFTKKIHYFVCGFFLIGLGIVSLLSTFGMIDFNPKDFPVMNLGAYFFVLYASKDMFMEAFKEQESKLKWPTMIFAAVLIILQTIPTLYSFEVLPFNLEFDDWVYNILYIISGIFLIIGIFTLLKSEEFSK
jgi:hypothetical protein